MCTYKIIGSAVVLVDDPRDLAGAPLDYQDVMVLARARRSEAERVQITVVVTSELGKDGATAYFCGVGATVRGAIERSIAIAQLRGFPREAVLDAMVILERDVGRRK